MKGSSEGRNALTGVGEIRQKISVSSLSGSSYCIVLLGLVESGFSLRLVATSDAKSGSERAIVSFR